MDKNPLSRDLDYIEHMPRGRNLARPDDPVRCLECNLPLEVPSSGPLVSVTCEECGRVTVYLPPALLSRYRVGHWRDCLILSDEDVHQVVAVWKFRSELAAGAAGRRWLPRPQDVGRYPSDRLPEGVWPESGPTGFVSHWAPELLPPPESDFMGRQDGGNDPTPPQVWALCMGCGAKDKPGRTVDEERDLICTCEEDGGIPCLETLDTPPKIWGKAWLCVDCIAQREADGITIERPKRRRG